MVFRLVIKSKRSEHFFLGLGTLGKKGFFIVAASYMAVSHLVKCSDVITQNHRVVLHNPFAFLRTRLCMSKDIERRRQPSEPHDITHPAPTALHNPCSLNHTQNSEYDVNSQLHDVIHQASCYWMQHEATGCTYLMQLLDAAMSFVELYLMQPLTFT